MKTTSFVMKAGQECEIPALDSERTLIALFADPNQENSKESIEKILAAYPNSHVIGCSSAGEIHDVEIHDEAVVCGVTQFQETNLRRVSAQINGPEESYDRGVELAEALNAPDLRGVFVLSDGLNVNGSALVRGINATLDSSVVVTGGLAGDGSRFAETWVVDNEGIRSKSIVAVGLYGDAVSIGHGSKGGWDLFGPERTITKSEGNVLYELDGKPALELYKSYLGDRASELPAAALLFPLSLRDSETGEKTLVRTILAVDEETQSMTFAGDVPEGGLVTLMRANFDRLVQGAETAVIEAGCQASDDVLCIAISCVGRRLVLGESTEEEVEATKDALPENSHQVGFYSYGELSPFASGCCELHNQTMTITTFSEKGK